MRNANDIRLRAPMEDKYSDAEMEILRQHPYCMRKLRKLGQPLRWGHALPLTFCFHQSCDGELQEHVFKAVENWNDFMRKFTSVESALQFVSDVAAADLEVGAQLFSWEGMFGDFVCGDVSQPIDSEEMGACTLYWNEDYVVQKGKILVPADGSRGEVISVGAHEFGHGLLLGHSPDVVGHLMFRYHGDVRRPTKRECRWAEDIWT